VILESLQEKCLQKSWGVSVGLVQIKKFRGYRRMDVFARTALTEQIHQKTTVGRFYISTQKCPRFWYISHDFKI
jgi:hypothetical protein